MRVSFSKMSLVALAAFTVMGTPIKAQADNKKNYIGEMETYRAVYEDTLVHLARDHGLGFVEVRAANPELDPWIPGEGAEVILPKRHLLPNAPREGLVINLPEMRVYAFLEEGAPPKTYPLGIGREGLDTPLGKTTIVRKKEGPTWRPTQRMRDEDPSLPAVVPPGPENPLGTHALYLGWPTYAIHGTTRPYGIGRRVSSGCIRMYPEDVVTFFEQVPVGTKVNVIDQPLKVAWIGNELYLEAHPSMEQAIRMEQMGAIQPSDMTEEEMALITDVAGRHAEYLNWPRIRMAVRERKGYPIRIARYFDEEVAAAETQDIQESETPEINDAPKDEAPKKEEARPADSIKPEAVTETVEPAKTIREEADYEGVRPPGMPSRKINAQAEQSEAEVLDPERRTQDGDI